MNFVVGSVHDQRIQVKEVQKALLSNRPKKVSGSRNKQMVYGSKVLWSH